MHRASAVSLIYGLRRGRFLDLGLRVADRLMSDPDYLVQKGYGWMLKEASKRYPNEVYEFVIQHQGEMPRASLRYAIEKLPERRRQEALGKTAQQGHPVDAPTSRN